MTFTYLTLTQGASPRTPVRYLNLPNPNPGGKPPGPPVRYLILPKPNPNPNGNTEIYTTRVIWKEIFFFIKTKIIFNKPLYGTYTYLSRTLTQGQASRQAPVRYLNLPNPNANPAIHEKEYFFYINNSNEKF